MTHAHEPTSCAAATNAAVELVWTQQQSLAELHASEIGYQVKTAPAKKRGAVIGSAAKLSSEGLMAAAKLARDKEERKRAEVCSSTLPNSHDTPAIFFITGSEWAKSVEKVARQVACRPSL